MTNEWLRKTEHTKICKVDVEWECEQTEAEIKKANTLDEKGKPIGFWCFFFCFLFFVCVCAYICGISIRWLVVSIFHSLRRIAVSLSLFYHFHDENQNVNSCQYTILEICNNTSYVFTFVFINWSHSAQTYPCVC